MDDRTVITRIHQGDREAYRLLVDRYRDRVYGVLVRMTADQDLAEELSQDAFVKAYRSLDAFRGDSAFGTWVVQIAIHGARDHFRRRRRDHLHGVISLEDYMDQASSTRELPADDRQIDALSRLQLDETTRRLERELADLPAPYREVFVLKHVEGWSFEDIAASTGDSVGSLKVRAHRARRMLRDALTRPRANPVRRTDQRNDLNTSKEQDHERPDGTLS